MNTDWNLKPLDTATPDEWREAIAQGAFVAWHFLMLPENSSGKEFQDGFRSGLMTLCHAVGVEPPFLVMDAPSVGYPVPEKLWRSPNSALAEKEGRDEGEEASQNL